MRAHGAKRDYDFNSRARQFRKSDLDRFDYIIVMDSSNYTNVKSLASTKEQLDKIHMMTDFSQRYSHDQVPDPYYGGASGFELVLDLLEDAVEGLLQAITEKHAFA
jgi:protein-tyrosine phosphatase